MKAVLLYNGQTVPSVPVARFTVMSEMYEDIEILLQMIKYQEHNWLICADLKVVALILYYTKFPCFLYLWDSRADTSHFSRKLWPARDEFLPRSKNVKAHPLVAPAKVFFTALAHQV